MATRVHSVMAYTELSKKGFSSLFETLFVRATTGILILDASGRIIAANPFLLKMFGYTGKELLGEDFRKLLPSSLRRNYSFYDIQYRKKSPDFATETGIDFFGRRKNGRSFPVEVNLSHCRQRRRSERYTIAFVNDLTTRKLARAKIKRLNADLGKETGINSARLAETVATLQEQIRKTNEADASLRATNHYLYALLNQAGVMIVTFDTKGIIQDFNPFIEQALGYDASTVCRKRTPLFYHDPDILARHAEELSRKAGRDITDITDFFATSTAINHTATYEWMFLRKDGSRFPVVLAITPLLDEHEEVSGFMEVAFDISERKRAEQDLRAALQKEKELSELKSKFVSLASHEFRTPLSTILSSAFLISKYVTSDDQPRRELHLQRIVSCVSMLTDTLNDFLSVGRIEEGKIQARFTRFNLVEVITELKSGIESNLRRGQVVYHLHHGDPMVSLDVSLLRHIVVNLLSNASKFSAEGAEICVTTTNESTQVVLSVRDHGIGISAEDQKHLFGRFFRGTNASNIQGTGLGLHIVKKYTELMGGSIRCNSVPDEGTEFILTFIKNPGYENNPVDRG